MKKILILLICFCLAFCIVACNTPDDSDTDTSTNTDTGAITDSDSDVGSDSDSNNNAVRYQITVVDQDGNKVVGARIALLDEDDDYTSSDIVITDENGVATFENVDSIYVKLKAIELPDYHINTAGTITISANETEITIEVTNNEPNGTFGREYNIGDNDEFEITVGAGKTVYYAIYGAGGRTFTIEGVESIEFTFDGEICEPSEDGIISFVIPAVDYSNMKKVMIIKNLDNQNEVTLTGTIVSPLGALDNPYDVISGELNEITIEKGTTVYYEWTATATGTAVITSESAGNDIYMQNLSTAGTIVSERTAGGTTTELNVTEGDIIRIFVASSLDTNYNTVEFTLEIVVPDAES